MMIKLSGLWTGKDKNNNPMMSGNLTASLKFLILKNTNKRSEKDPDYILNIAKIEKEKPESAAIEEAPF